MHLIAEPILLLIGHDRKKDIIPQRWRSNHIEVWMMRRRQLQWCWAEIIRRKSWIRIRCCPWREGIVICEENWVYGQQICILEESSKHRVFHEADVTMLGKPGGCENPLNRLVNIILKRCRVAGRCGPEFFQDLAWRICPKTFPLAPRGRFLRDCRYFTCLF